MHEVQEKLYFFVGKSVEKLDPLEVYSPQKKESFKTDPFRPKSCNLLSLMQVAS